MRRGEKPSESGALPPGAAEPPLTPDIHLRQHLLGSRTMGATPGAARSFEGGFSGKSDCPHLRAPFSSYCSLLSVSVRCRRLPSIARGAKEDRRFARCVGVAENSPPGDRPDAGVSHPFLNFASVFRFWAKRKSETPRQKVWKKTRSPGRRK